MEKMAIFLTDYVIKKGVIENTERNLYKYGFQVSLEMGLCILICSAIAGALEMGMEGILFFIIFIPLRSYAGGLHLDNYWSCLFLSCLTFSVILMICKIWRIEAYVSFFILLLLILFVWILYPVENVNRDVDEKENLYFRKKLRRYLLLDVIISIACMALHKETYLLLCMVTFFMVVVTMLIGKMKNKIKKQNRF